MTNVQNWRLAAAGAILLGALLTIPVRNLWDPDEPRYAGVAYEMLVSGQWVVPHLGGVPYPQKPPLYMWLEAALRTTGLSWTAAGVLPSLLALLATLWLLPRLARAAGLDADTGAIAATMLAASPLVATFALAARMDMLMVLLETAALLFLARLLGVAGGAPARTRDHVLLWVVLALGVLVKGPVAAALPLLAAIASHFVIRRRPSLRPVFRGWGPAVFVVLVLAWLVPAAVLGGAGYIGEILVRQSLGRLARSFAHSEPFYFHALTYPLTGLPWSGLAVLGVARELRSRAEDGLTFLALAATAVLVFFSLISGKLVLYLLPLFPPALLVAAATLRRAARGTRGALLAGASLMFLVGMTGALARHWRPELAGVPRVIEVAGAVVALPAVLAVGLLLRRRTAAGVAALAISGLAYPALALPVAARVLDPLMTVRDVALAIRQLEPQEREGLIYGVEYPGLAIYAERPFRTLRDAADVRAALQAGRWVLLEERDLKRLRQELKGIVTERRSFAHRRRELLLLGGRRAAGRPAP